MEMDEYQELAELLVRRMRALALDQVLEEEGLLVTKI